MITNFSSIKYLSCTLWKISWHDKQDKRDKRDFEIETHLDNCWLWWKDIPNMEWGRKPTQIPGSRRSPWQLSFSVQSRAAESDLRRPPRWPVTKKRRIEESLPLLKDIILLQTLNTKPNQTQNTKQVHLYSLISWAICASILTCVFIQFFIFGNVQLFVIFIFGNVRLFIVFIFGNVRLFIVFIFGNVRLFIVFIFGNVQKTRV